MRADPFSRFGQFLQTDDGVRKSVAAVGALVGGVVGLIHWAGFALIDDLPILDAMFEPSSGMVLLLAILWGCSGVLPFRAGAALQIVGFVVSGFLGALTGDPGSLTGAVFMGFAILLTWTYISRPWLRVSLGITWLLLLAGAQIANLQSSVTDPILRTITSLIASGGILMLISIFITRATTHLKNHNRLLDQRVQRRTEELEALLREHEMTVQEVHHRVKNNLQFLVSMLNIKERTIEDPHALSIISDTRERIFAISLVHRTLHRGRDLAQLNFSTYVRDLVDHLRVAFASNVSIQYDIPEHITLSLDKAVSLGVALNELVTNALKHAFPDGDGGVIHLRVQEQEDTLTLSVSDSGVGYPFEEIESSVATTGSGMTITNAAVEHLDGTITVHHNSGTTFTITFPREDQ